MICVTREWCRVVAKVQVAQMGRDHDQNWLTEVERAANKFSEDFRSFNTINATAIGHVQGAGNLMSHSIPHVASSDVTFCQIQCFRCCYILLISLVCISISAAGTVLDLGTMGLCCWWSSFSFVPLVLFYHANLSIATGEWQPIVTRGKIMKLR